MIIIYVLHLIFALVTGYCTISKSLNVEDYTRHTYPLDVYCSNSSISSDRSLQCSKITNPLKKKKYDCYSQGSTIDWHTCTPQSFVCPLHAANILESMKRMKMATFTSSICNFDDALRAKSISTVNIIVLGGSVTNGVSTFGCNCLQTEDPLCPLNTTKQQCKWSSYLDSWTQEYLSPRIRVINLSVRGFTSSLMSDNIFFFLKRENVLLTYRDVILIDHSVNDGIVFGHDKPISMSNALDSLISRIYYAASLNHHLFMNERDTRIRISSSSKRRFTASPTIILLGFSPLPFLETYLSTHICRAGY